MAYENPAPTKAEKTQTTWIGVVLAAAAVTVGAVWGYLARRKIRDGLVPDPWPSQAPPYEPGHVVQFRVDYDSGRREFITTWSAADSDRSGTFTENREWGIVFMGPEDSKVKVRAMLSARDDITFSNPQVQGLGVVLDASQNDVLADLGKWAETWKSGRIRKGSWALQVQARAPDGTTKAVRLYMVALR